MNITIDGKTYAGEATAQDQKLAVLVEEEISTGFGWNKPMTITAGKTDYAVSSLLMLAQAGVLLRAEWAMDSELSRLEKQVEQMQEQIVERDSMLDRIREALSALGSGVPTLTKLTAFLAAVKEAINYGTNAD